MIEINNSESVNLTDYQSAIGKIKSAIVKSRYRVVSVANTELLRLYFSIGEYISLNTRNKNWGKGAIDYISSQLQSELNGLRGFSSTNLKNMRLFYEEWSSYLPQNCYETIADKEDFVIRQLPTAEPQEDANRQLPTADIQSDVNRQLPTAEFNEQELNNFFHISFTHHREIIRNCKEFNERIFYIKECAEGFWSIEKLKYNVKSNLFNKKGKLQNNFDTTIEKIQSNFPKNTEIFYRRRKILKNCCRGFFKNIKIKKN